MGGIAPHQDKDSGEIIKGERGDYYGYAMVVFRDADEAKDVRVALDGVEVDPECVFLTDVSTDAGSMPSFCLKVKNVSTQKKHESLSSSNNEEDEAEKDGVNEVASSSCIGGQDPPLIDQLRPLTIPELQERCNYLKHRLEEDGIDLVLPDDGDNNDDDDDTDTNGTTKLQIINDTTTISKRKKPKLIQQQQQHNKILNQTVSLYNTVLNHNNNNNNNKRKEIHHRGKLLPESIRTNLLTLLQNLRWPASSHRKGLTSDHYLVLQTNVTNDLCYNDLRVACRELMNWADDNYYYSGIAVTKNFVASPHIDDRDQTFQYAVSLGDFGHGGELCVEGKDEDGYDYVNVVETKNRIAKVDGRNIHWVRSWSSVKDRYSLIYYDTTDRYSTSVSRSGIIV
eukprot:7696457-Ditylum_brightwellii.AAC.1